MLEDYEKHLVQQFYSMITVVRINLEPSFNRCLSQYSKIAAVPTIVRCLKKPDLVSKNFVLSNPPQEQLGGAQHYGSHSSHFEVS